MRPWHTMLDLETLDTSPTAVVLSIGAVAFDPDAVTLNESNHAKFHVVLDIGSQKSCGRTISGDTVTWWMQQSAEARQLFGAEKFSVDSALSKFTSFLAEYSGGKPTVWGNGADFDNIILGSLYDAVGITKPWSYSRNRCFRTMKNLVGLDHMPVCPMREGTHHNALDDALHQTKHLLAICNALRVQL